MELGIDVLVDDSPVNIARARRRGHRRRHDRPPLERRAGGARRSDRRPRLDRAAGASSTRCSTGSAERMALPDGLRAARRPSGCGAAAACASSRSGPGWCPRARPTRPRSRGCCTGWPPAAAAPCEIGVHEGAASLVLVAGLPQGADLHLVDPFGEAAQWWEPADEHAVKAAGGPRRQAPRRPAPATGTWRRREDVASDWSTPVDLVFIDGDHSRDGVPARLGRSGARTCAAAGVVAFHGARGGDPGPDRGGHRAVRRGRPARLADPGRARHDRGRRAARLASAALR